MKSTASSTSLEQEDHRPRQTVVVGSLVRRRWRGKAAAASGRANADESVQTCTAGCWAAPAPAMPGSGANGPVGAVTGGPQTLGGECAAAPLCRMLAVAALAHRTLHGPREGCLGGGKLADGFLPHSAEIYCSITKKAIRDAKAVRVR